MVDAVRLTDRELQLLRLVSEDQNNKAIAVIASLAVDTVRDYVAELMQDLGVNGRPGLVRFGWRYSPAVWVKGGWVTLREHGADCSCPCCTGMRVPVLAAEGTALS